MKRLIALVVLVLVGFYGVWPAWSSYRIATAIQGRNAALLESKIDFASVRTGLRPVVETQVGKEIDKQMGQGLGAVLGGDLKRQLAPQLVDMVLDKVINGETVIRIAAEGGDAAATVQKIMMEQMSKAGGLPGMPGLPGMGGGSSSGGLGGLGSVLGSAGAASGGRMPGGLNIPGFGGGGAAPAPAVAPKAEAPRAQPASKPSYGLANIKSFGFAGPLGYRVSLAKDPASPKADATVTMRFTGFDWRITDVTPHLD